MLNRLIWPLIIAVLLVACGQHDARDSARAELNPPANAYTQAAPCSAEDTNCQTLLDMYERKPGFKEQLVVALELSEIARPLWLDNALSTRLVRTSDHGVPLVMGRVCEPRNCAQILYVAYKPEPSRVFGFYRTNDRAQWFGDPDDAEKVRLCEAEPACPMENRVSELPQVLVRWSYPLFTQPAEFPRCDEIKGGITAKDGFVCSEQFVVKCPYAVNGCTVSGQFVGDQPASLSFKGKYRQIKYDELKKALDKAYGVAETTTVQPDAANKQLASWTTVWKDGRVEITLRRVKGVNALGERYDDVWMVFADKAFALFN